MSICVRYYDALKFIAFDYLEMFNVTVHRYVAMGLSCAINHDYVKGIHFPHGCNNHKFKWYN